MMLILGALLVADTVPVSAAPGTGLELQTESAVHHVQRRPGGGGGGRPPHARPPHGGGRPPHARPPHGRPPHHGGRPPVIHHHHHHRGRYYRGWGPSGAAVGVGIVGGIIAGAAMSDAARQNAWNRCAADFRSFNPATGTIRGHDGVVRACPYLQ